MSSTTTNLGLTKPASSDNVSLSVINDNYDIIDTFAGGVPTIIANPTGTFQNDLTAITIGSNSYNVGTSSVSGMSDVALTTPTNGQILKFNSSTAKWENANETGGSVSVNDLTDTAIASVTNGQVLTYNSVSGKWVNADVPSGGGGTIYAPTDTTYTATWALNGHHMYYEATLTKYVNGDEASHVTLNYSDFSVGTKSKDLDDIQIGVTGAVTSPTTYIKALDDTIAYNNNYFNTGDTIISSLTESETYNLSLVEELTPTEVSWSQVVNTGTKIATITINNTPTDVYAPTSGGASALSGLSDVSISSVTDGQFLTYDSTSSKWNNESVTLGDTVGVTQVQSTGTKIATVTVNGTGTDIYAPTSGGATALSGLSDVDLTTPSDGQVLTYDNTNSKWINANASGGTTVIANPIGTPTDELNTIQIGNDIYEVAGGSGGSGYSKTLLYEISGNTPESVITLSQSIENFDLIEVVSLYGHTDEEDYKNTTMFNAEELVNSIGTTRPKNWWVGNDTVYVWFYVTDVDEFTIHTQTGQTGLGIWYVYGYKFEGGGSGNSVFTGKSLVMKTKTYTGDGNSSLSVTFTEKPVAIYNIFGDGLNQVNKVLCLPFIYGDTTYVVGSYALGGNGMLWNSISYSNSDLTMTMTASDAGAAFNNSGSTYTIWYLVEQNFNELKDLTGTLTTGSTSITLSDSSISADSTIEIFNSLDVPYNSKTIDTTTTPPSITVTFDAQESDMTVKVRVS